MKISGKVYQVCKFIGQHIVNSPICVETGCICTDDQGNRFDTTTNNIMEFICAPKNGSLYSFDINPKSIEIARNYAPLNAHVNFIQGDSVDNIKEFVATSGLKIDLLCLDSLDGVGNENHMLNEFMAARNALAESHYILVDDIHNPGSVKYKDTVPFLKTLGYNFVEVETPTGMFVAAKNYPIPASL